MYSAGRMFLNQVFFVWFTVSLFYAYQYILRVLPSILMSDITGKFDLSPDVFGQFSGVYYIGYALAHLPIGAMLDRYGPKKVLPFFILLTVLGTLPLIVASHWSYLIIGRILVGIGSSAAILGVFKVVRNFFDASKFSRMLSFSVTIGLAGAIYGGGPVHSLRVEMGFYPVVVLFLALGLILAGLTYLMMPEVKTESNSISIQSVFRDASSILSNRAAIILCLASGFMVGPLEGFADVWGVQFLRTVYQFDDNVAASLPSLIFLGMCFGGPILSLIAEFSGSHLLVMLFSALAMGGGFTLLLSGILTPFYVSVLFVVIGICCAYQILALDQVSKQVEPRQTGMATALANMIIMIFGYLFHGAIGKVVAVFSEPTQFVASNAALMKGVAVIPTGLFIGAMGVLWVIQSRVPSRN
jgi:MFS family permease